MTTHPIQTTGTSQSDRIHRRLRESSGEWVDLPELVKCSGAYAVHSRVSDLRKRGVHVEHRNIRHGKTVMSFYRLPRN